MGRDSQGPLRGKLRGRTKPQILRFARGSTTPTPQANATPEQCRCRAALEFFIRRAQLAPVLFGKGVEGEDVLVGRLEHRSDFGQRPLELLDCSAERLARGLAVGLIEERPDQRREQAVLVLARVPEAVSEEVDGAALPGRAEHLRQGGLEARVGVRDGELDPNQAAGDQRAQELTPERLGLRLPDVQADDLASARLMDGVGDHHALAHDPATITHLLDLRVDEQVGVAALQGPCSEGLDLLVEQRADPRDLRL
ncbi:MAG: hypothetical protein H0T69_08495 [Thermoleophilaceae bacterium]|nr:hypothetical protein [Thermoleophilaceae bacterium]